MRATVILLTMTAVLFSSACPSSSVENPAESAVEDLPALVEGNTEFALKIFGALSSDAPGGNLFFSPFSISTALGMTYAGADGETEAQMADVLHFTLPQASLHSSFHGLLEKLSLEYRESLSGANAEPLVLEIANALWVEATFPLLAGYVDIVEAEYGAEARNVDFIGDSDGQRIAINDWVSERTSDRIKDLLAPGVISNMTRVVLTNAVYFKSSWMHQFQEGATWDDDFTLLNGSVVSVPMMHQTDAFAYGRDHGCSAISLPYSDGMSSMLILLPDSDIGEFEESLDLETLDAIKNGLVNSQVYITMPSFEFTSSFSLNEILEDMGMTDAFDPAIADFTGFTGNRDLYISAVIHKAFVKVDETGTEAAAATAVVMNLASAAPQEPQELVLDRPFLFMVMDDLTGSILFMGRMADPSV